MGIWLNGSSQDTQYYHRRIYRVYSGIHIKYNISLKEKIHFSEKFRFLKKLHLASLSARHISKSKGKFKKEKIWNLSEGLRLSNWTASDFARPVPKQIFSLSQVHFITLLFCFIIFKKCPFQTKFVLQYSSKSSWWDMCGKLYLKTSLLKMPQKK